MSWRGEDLGVECVNMAVLRGRAMPTDISNDYQFGSSRDGIERLGDQHHVWAERIRLQLRD